MRQMTTEKLFDEGKYMVIYLYPEAVKGDERMFFMWNKEDLAEAQKRGKSCEEMVSYHERFRVTLSLLCPYSAPASAPAFVPKSSLKPSSICIYFTWDPPSLPVPSLPPTRPGSP